MIIFFIALQALTDGLTELLEAEKARLQMEISQAADKALCAIQKWYAKYL